MKRVIITCMMLAIVHAVNAQSAMSHGKWEENSQSKSKSQAQEPNEFSDVEMSVSDKVATFSGLPDLKKGAVAVVTDANGESMMQKTINPENNYLDLHRLSKGEMYFVTIMYKNKSRKGFVVHL